LQADVISTDFELAPYHDVAAYAAQYAAKGRVHIPNLMREDDVRRLHAAVAARTPWHLLVIHNGHRQVPLSQWEVIPAPQKAAMEASFAVAAATPGQFAARFLNAHLSPEGQAYEGDVPEFAALVRFLNSEAFLDFARAVTGDSAIRLTDVHASCYRAGDFLHRHSDHIEEAHGVRSAAYVLGLSPVWCPEWGGLLNFLGPDGHVDEAWTPAFNAMNFLKVPQLHFVGPVAGFITAPRLSINGWVRRR
jgi:Rps23 Pro-64 3,4-dihydroxylase Tpa1-like proline 4-hydroxylase